MFNLIAGDLKQIVDENMLPDAYNGNNMGRVTSGAAQALLGKVYLTFHKWEVATTSDTRLTLLPANLCSTMTMTTNNKSWQHLPLKAMLRV
jgi:hypothetical protein